MIADFLSDIDFWTYVAIGFFAQIIDGALGMAYGTVSIAVLLASGLPPLIVSASVHTAQFFTTGISSLSHAYFRNIDMNLVRILVLGGVLGGILGALLLTIIDGDAVRPWISAYLLGIGILIVWKMIRGRFSQKPETPPHKHRNIGRGALALFGGFCDALGGGWGPLMTSNLIAKGDEEPRFVIGSVNTAEFFVKTVITATFIATVGFNFHEITLGLLLGGIIAAPMGAYILRWIKPEYLIGMVGVLVVLLSGSVLLRAVL